MSTTETGPLWPSAAETHRARSVAQYAPSLALVAMTLLCSIHLLTLIDRFSVNLLTDDLWDVYGAFFSDAGAWELFRWPHLPHRQGLGNWFIAVVNGMSHWNVRALSFAMAGTMILSCLIAIRLRVLIGGSLRFTDVAIPGAVLTTAQFGTFTRVPNPAHSVVPLLLILVTVLIWISASGWRRAVLVGAISFAAVHTGFAFFIAPLLVIRYAISCLSPASSRAQRVEALAGITLCSATVLAFFVDYPAWWAGGSGIEPRSLIYVPTFIQISMARFVGVSFLRWGLPATAVGLVLSVWAGVVTVRAATALWRRNSTKMHETIALLGGFSALYIGCAAIGRSHLSPMTGEWTRYMTLLIPGFLALYFGTLAFGNRRWSWVAMTIILAGSLPLAWSDTHPAADRALHASAWRDCYLRERDVESCTRRALFTVYSASAEATRLQEKLDYLETHELNLFATDVRP